MPKLDLLRAVRIKGPGGNIKRLKGMGFVWPYGDDRPAGALLAGRTRGTALDFLNMDALVRWPEQPGSQFRGDPNDLLTYTAPSTKWIRNHAGVYESGTTLRTEYDVNGNPLGLRVEGVRANVVLHNRDLTNGVWTKTNVTAAKDQIGIDGEANSASSITATSANGTCLQSITLASSQRFQSAFVRRITGTGTVEMTMDGGSTWTAITVTANWTRVSIPTAALANPTVGFRLVTSGDAIAVDFVQNENGTFASSPIETAGSAVTRAADDIWLPTSLFPNTVGRGTLLVDWAFVPGMTGVDPDFPIRSAPRILNDSRNSLRGLGAQAQAGNALFHARDAATANAITLNGAALYGGLMRWGQSYDGSTLRAAAQGVGASSAQTRDLSTWWEQLWLTPTHQLSGGNSSVSQAHAWLRSVVFIPEALSQAQLEVRTAV